MQYIDMIGTVGVACVLLAYFLLHNDNMKASDLSYSVLNLFGAVLILFSLYYEWNLPSFIVESMWAVISLFGIYNSLKHRSLRRTFSAPQSETRS